MTTMNVDVLAKENVRLYEENLKLRLLLGKDTKNSKKTTVNETKKENTKKSNGNRKTVKKASTKNNTKPASKKANVEKLSKFQQEREAKKAVVLAKRVEKVPVPEIAKAIGQSEPTVRNYIRELRSEGKLAK